MDVPAKPTKSGNRPTPLIVTLILWCFCFSLSVSADELSWEVESVETEYQWQWFDDSNMISRSTIQSEMLLTPKIVQELYEKNSYHPLWSAYAGNHQWLEEAKLSLADLEFDALPTWRYHLREISQLQNQPDKSWLLDLHLTDAFVTAISDLSGNLLPEDALGKQWKMKNEAVDIKELISTLQRGNSAADLFNSIRPQHPQYQLLRTAYKQSLNKPRTALLSDGEKLQPGDSGERVKELYARLQAEGLLDSTGPDKQTDHYNKTIKTAVIRYQKLNGLKPDGVVGHKTRAALNRGSEEISRTIALNLQRWRAAPPGFHKYLYFGKYRCAAHATD